MSATPPAGRNALMLCDGLGLYLQVSRDRVHGDRVYRSWTFRYEIAGKRRELGLGGTHTISLAEARDKARTLRQQLLDGVDPHTERRKQREALIAERAKAVTFKEVAEAYLELHLDSFTNPKHQKQWRTTLATYVYPKIGHMPVAGIGPADVLRVVEPIWNDKRETASRVRQRVERILDYAATRQYRSGDNPAAHVTESLPKGKNGQAHHAAMPFLEVPEFMAKLQARDSVSARALEFTILTAARTGETIGATWEEIDFKARTWTVPAERMKAGKEHRVPLSERAVQILREVGQHEEKDRLFSVSNTAMFKLLRGMRPGVTTHGFRSTFMDWAHERTAFPKVVIDMALAHTIGDKVEAAYRRGDLFEKRRRLMADWAAWCTRPVPTGATVTTIGARRG
jgi:integrase